VVQFACGSVRLGRERGSAAEKLFGDGLGTLTDVAGVHAEDLSAVDEQAAVDVDLGDVRRGG
jgi:hypothetical protein